MSVDKRTYERAKMLGEQARRACKGIEANPYANRPSMRAESCAWIDGWWAANSGPGRQDMAQKVRR